MFEAIQIWVIPTYVGHIIDKRTVGQVIWIMPGVYT
jgi:hypothetical protein